ncbi:MAG: lactate utilization protein C [Acidobacteriota bacterium]
MTARKGFIEGISKALGRGTHTGPVPKPSWRHSVHREVMKDWSRGELAREFLKYSRTIGIDASETTREGLNASIRKSLEQAGPGPVMLADDSLLEELNTATALGSGREVRVWDKAGNREEELRFAEKASVGVAVARLALAESATVLLFSHEGCGRSITLLPESVVYIIPESRIRSRLTQGMEFLQRQQALPSSVNFVSGPSATSDIELVRVVGVHGPVHVVHLVVNDI